MILLIDNYDSFSYNLYQLIGELNSDIKVIRNDAMTVDEIKLLKPAAIIISPGPGRPENAGICIELIKRCEAFAPILGVCLGIRPYARHTAAILPMQSILCTANSRI